jgi:hypothetical protein
MLHSINIDIYICMSAHPYKYTDVYTILMSTSKRLDWLNFEIHKVGQRAHRYQ